MVTMLPDGNRNIKINGENIKPILADAVNQLDNVEVINQFEYHRLYRGR